MKNRHLIEPWESPDFNRNKKIYGFILTDAYGDIQTAWQCERATRNTAEE